MARVLFYEKPGCINNTRQKRMLEALGHALEVRNLLAEEWTVERLRPFFGDLAVADWFNPSAPRVKSGEVDPTRLDEDEALRMMTADPLLIRRPLIETADGRMAGFDACPLLDGLGVVLPGDEDIQSCPRSHEAAACSGPG